MYGEGMMTFLGIKCVRAINESAHFGEAVWYSASVPEILRNNKTDVN